MLSSVLNSERAVQVNVEIMRAFVRLRETVSTHKDLARQLIALESRYDRQFKVVFDAIRGLMKKSIGAASPGSSRLEIVNERSSGHRACQYVNDVPHRPQNARNTSGDERYSVGFEAVNSAVARATVQRPTACAPVARRQDAQ
jgi:hypothetical protein